MKIKKVLAMCLISAMVLGSFAGCGKDEGESTVSVNQEDPAWKEAMTTPYGKYPETVNYTLGKEVTNFDVLDGTKYEGDDDEIGDVFHRDVKLPALLGACFGGRAELARSETDSLSDDARRLDDADDAGHGDTADTDKTWIVAENLLGREGCNLG